MVCSEGGGCKMFLVAFAGPAEAVQSWSSKKIGSSTKGASALGGSGACSPRKFFNLASLKCTFDAFSERINKKMNWNLQWKLHVLRPNKKMCVSCYQLSLGHQPWFFCCHINFFFTIDLSRRKMFSVSSLFLLQLILHVKLTLLIKVFF